jgi:hypothetical protein
MTKPLRAAPAPPPAPTHLRTTLTASLAFTPRRTLERFACFLGVIGPTEVPSSSELLRRVSEAL